MREKKIPVKLLFSNYFYQIILDRREKAKYKSLSCFVEDQLLQYWGIEEEVL
jgi:hypothetical protein